MEHIIKEDYNFQYWPDNMKPKLNNAGRVVQFGQIKKKTLAYDQFIRKRHRNVTGAVLQYILTNDNFQNTTVITQSSQDLIAIASGLLEDQITPNVLRNENSILEVSVRDCNLRFIDISNYQGQYSPMEIMKEYNKVLKPLYFPQNLDATLLNTDVIPELHHFADFNDTTIVSEEKMSFINSFCEAKITYNVRDEGLEYINILNKALAQLSLNYVRESLEFQKELIPHLGDPVAQSTRKNSMQLLHPLSMPLVSKGSYIWSVYLSLIHI